MLLSYQTPQLVSRCLCDTAEIVDIQRRMMMDKQIKDTKQRNSGFLWTALVAMLLLGIFAWFVGDQITIQEAEKKEAEKAEKANQQAQKRKAERKLFYDTFGVELPAPEARGIAQAYVIKKLVEVGRRADIATQQVESIDSLWEKTPVTIKGVAERLKIQNKYDEAEKERKESYEKFRQICRVTRNAGFDEEARALYCP